MKTYSTPVTNYRNALREAYFVFLISVQVRDRDTNALVWYHFSSRDENETIAVVNQIDDPELGDAGEISHRDYFGGGHIIAVDDIVRSEGTVVRNHTITLSGTSEQVLDMIQGYDCRDAVIELHVGEGEDTTGLLVDTPVCELDGFVDTIDQEDGALDPNSATPATSNFRVSIAGHLSTLQRTNPDMRSYEIGQERSGDEIFLHADDSNTWDLMWGEEGHKHKHNADPDDGRNKVSTPPPVLGRR